MQTVTLEQLAIATALVKRIDPLILAEMEVLWDVEAHALVRLLLRDREVAEA